MAWRLGVGGGAVLALVAAIAFGMNMDREADPPPVGAPITEPSGQSPRHVADEADPKDASCASDPELLSLDEVELSYDGAALGQVELRYSPACGVAWPRFVPFAAAAIPDGVLVRVDAVRPEDGRRAPFEAPYAGTEVYGNVLRSTRTCVFAEARLVGGVGWSADPVARTACHRGRVREVAMGAVGRR